MWPLLAQPPGEVVTKPRYVSRKLRDYHFITTTRPVQRLYGSPFGVVDSGGKWPECKTDLFLNLLLRRHAFYYLSITYVYELS